MSARTIAALLLLSVSLLAEEKTSSRSGYVGDQACRTCHQEIFATYFQTAHHFTSRGATPESVLGSFTPGSNVLTTTNPELSFRMESKNGELFQSAVTGSPPHTSSRSERLAVVIGSGRKGQTYLYWKNDQLFELPVSYWTELGQWVNSPGYADGFADFDRPIFPRCFECHASFAQTHGPQPGNRYNPPSLVLGITCERCHGPGAEHISRFAAKNAGNADSAIVNPARLDREHQMDGCALCHGGVGSALAPAFSFHAGDKLSDYLRLPTYDPSTQIDVHGSQYELLKLSRCYQSSDKMTCTTCHDVHKPQRNAASFSDRCLSCHQIEQINGAHGKFGSQIANNCVDCHMPLRQTQLIVSSANGKTVQPLVRSHWIKIYPAAAQSSSPKSN